MFVLIDTNIWLKDPFFKSDIYKLFINKFVDGHFKMVMSEVVYKELVVNYQKNVADRQSAYLLKVNDLNKHINAEISVDSVDLDLYKFQLEQFIRNLKTTYGMILVKPKAGIFREVIERAVHHKKPFARNGSGFKDCLIWLSYSDLIRKNNLKDIHFISNNVNDFFSEDKTKIHEDLSSDIKNISVYKSINEFIDVHREKLKISGNKALSDQIEKWKKDIRTVNRMMAHHKYSFLYQEVDEYFSRNKPVELFRGFEEKFWLPESGTIRIVSNNITSVSIYDDFAEIVFKTNFKIEGYILDSDAIRDAQKQENEYGLDFEMEYEMELDESLDLVYTRRISMHLRNIGKIQYKNEK